MESNIRNNIHLFILLVLALTLSISLWAKDDDIVSTKQLSKREIPASEFGTEERLWTSYYYSTAELHLSEVGVNKITVIKVVQEITGLGLKEAKDLVDRAPVKIKEYENIGHPAIPSSDAILDLQKLEAAGAKGKIVS